MFFIPFALKLNPMIGAFAMSFSSMFVITHALRRRWFKPKLAAENSGAAPAELTAAEQVKGKAEIEKALKIEGMMCQH